MKKKYQVLKEETALRIVDLWEKHIDIDGWPTLEASAISERLGIKRDQVSWALQNYSKKFQDLVKQGYHQNSGLRYDANKGWKNGRIVHRKREDREGGVYQDEIGEWPASLEG